MESLLTDLISWWSLDETSGTRADSHGTQDLTDVNTVLSATGLQGNAADFESTTSEQLTHADSAELSVGDISFTWAAWVKAESFGTNRPIIHKGNGSSSYEYALLYLSSPNRFWFAVTASGGIPSASVTATTPTPATATWYFIVAWHDSAANQVGIQVNDGTIYTTSYTSGSHNSANTFRIGSDGAGAYWDGLVDEAAFWKRILTAEEKTWLYNSGAARAYADLTPAPAADSSSYSLLNFCY